MTTNYEPYFKVMKQVAAERGAEYSFGRDWASVDSTRDGERVVVESSFYEGSEGVYFVTYTFEVDAQKDAVKEHVDSVVGATAAELMRFVEKWV